MTSALRQSEQVNIPGRLERLPLTAYQKRLFVIVATAWLADQVDVALLVFLIGDLKNYFDLTPVQVGYLASMTFLGQLTGNLLIGSISDLFGRRIAFQSTMVIWGLASFLAAGAWDVVSLMVFRFLIGVGVGGEAPVAQAVLSEIIPANVRAKYIAFMEGFWAVNSSFPERSPTWFCLSPDGGGCLLSSVSSRRWCSGYGAVFWNRRDGSPTMAAWRRRKL